jgi:hypothetical protein
MFLATSRRERVRNGYGSVSGESSEGEKNLGVVVA